MTSLNRHFSSIIKLSFVAVLLLQACTVSADHHADAVPVSESSKTGEPEQVAHDPAFDSLFVPEQRGFLGADGAATVQINENKILWIFGDTILGKNVNGERKGSMVRNSIAIQDISGEEPGEIQYYWDLTDGLMDSFFHPDDWLESHWYWPGCGVELDGKLYLFLSKMDSGDGPAGFAFRTINCTLFTVHNPEDDPHEWNMTQQDLDLGDDHFNINAGAMIRDGYVWLIGYDDGPDDNPSKRSMILSRMSFESLKSDDPAAGLEYWTSEETWSSSLGNFEYLFTPGVTETSLHYDESLNRFVTITMVPFQDKLHVATAEKLTGPWTVHEASFTIEKLAEDENYLAYAGRAHPFLTDDNTLLVTYIINTKDFWGMFSDMDIYYPRFIRIDMNSLK